MKPFKLIISLFFLLCSSTLSSHNFSLENRTDLRIIQSTNDNFSLLKWTKSVFENLKEFRSPGNGYTNNKPDTKPIIDIDNLTFTINQYVKSFKKSIDEKEWIGIGKDSSLTDLFMISDSSRKTYEFKSDYYSPYIKKLDFNTEHNVCVIGDIHGSIHPLLRNILRLMLTGYISNEGILAEDTTLIFLGDYVSRGSYGVEVLYTVLNLKILNPNNVFLIRGNHEEINLPARWNLYTELQKYFSTNREITSYLQNYINRVYNLMPLGIFVGHKKNYMFLSHAGIDPLYSPIELLSNKDKKNEFLIGRKALYDNCINESVESSMKTFLDTHEKCKVPDGFRFYGFNRAEVGTYFTRKSHKVRRKSHHSSSNNLKYIIWTKYGYFFPKKILISHIKYINDILLSNGAKLKGIIRGHQHHKWGMAMLPSSNFKFSQNLFHWSGIVDIEDIKYKSFLINKYFPIFTFISAPEGVGFDSVRHVLADYDSYGIFRLSEYPDKWIVEPKEYLNIGRSSAGLYLDIKRNRTDYQDPIEIHYNNHKASYFNLEEFKNNKIIKTISESEERFIDSLVNRIYEKIKKIKDSKNREFVAVPENLSEINLSENNSLSLSHLKSMESISSNPKYESWENYVKSWFASGKRKRQDYILSVAKKILKEEAFYFNKKGKSFFSFYHSYNGSQQLFFDVYKQIFDWGFLNKSEVVPLRSFFGNKLSRNLVNYLNDNKELIDSLLKNNGTRFNNMPGKPAQLLSVNPFLFGNSTLKSSSSWRYFLDNKSVLKLDRANIIKKLFSTLNFDDLYIDKLLYLADEFLLKNSGLGTILQILIDKNEVDKLLYFSLPGGIPISTVLVPRKESDVFLFLPEPCLKSFGEGSKFIFSDAFSINPSIDYNIKSKIHKLIGKNTDDMDFNFNIDRLQARIWMQHPFLYNGNITKIKRYRSIPDNEINDEGEYNSSSARVWEFIIKSFIRNKIEKNIPSYVGNGSIKRLDGLVNSLVEKLLYNQGKTVSDNRIMEKSLDNEIINSKHDTNLLRKYEEVLLKYKKNGNKKLLIKIINQFSFEKSLKLRLSDNMTPLILAIRTKNTVLLEFLVKRASELKKTFLKYNGDTDFLGINLKDKFGYTALMLAAQYGLYKSTKLLLESNDKIDLKAINYNGKTALMIAAQQKYYDILRLLLEKSAKIDVGISSNIPLLIFASAEGNYAVVKILLNDVTNINETDSNGNTALMLASRNDHKTVVELLLKNNANINAKNKNGDTALLQAFNRGDKDIIKFLLKMGAYIDIKNSSGDTMLIQACDQGDKNMVQFLLEKGADIKTANNEGNTALTLAVVNENKEIVKLLSDYK